jgi:O-antigen ligase
MLVRLVALAILGGVIAYLARRLQPTRFGLVFGLFLVYLPLHLRAPLHLFPMVNGLIAFFAALVLLMPGNRPPLRQSGFPVLVVVYAALSVVGLVLSPQFMATPEPALVELKRWLDPLLFGWLALAAVRDEDRKFMLASATIGYIVVAVHAAREGGDYGPLKRIPGLLGHPNETAAFLAMYAPIAFAIALGLFRGLPRLALIAAVGLGGYALIFTESRGAMIAYPLGLVLTLALMRRTTLAAITAAGIMAAWMMPEILPERVATRFESTVVEETANVLEDAVETSAAQRIRNWKAALTAIASQPLGVGLGQFKNVIGAYGGVSGLDAHNVFLLVGVELGLPGLALVVTLFVAMMTSAWRARRAEDAFTQTMASAVLATIAAAVVVNLFGSRLMQDQPSTYLWVLTAMVTRADGARSAAVDARTPAWQTVRTS